MHQMLDTPPPPAPVPRALFESFQTISCWLAPVPRKLVPPTPMTNGALAGVRALTLGLACPELGRKQLVDPSSPAAAKIVWPCALACSNTDSCAFMLASAVSASQEPHDTDSTRLVSETANFLKMS